MKYFELKSRYGDVTKLIHIKSNIYKVDFTDNPYSYRVILEEDNKTIKAFDPSGGPFVSIGDEVLPGLKVTSIYKDEELKSLVLTLDFIE